MSAKDPPKDSTQATSEDGGVEGLRESKEALNEPDLVRVRPVTLDLIKEHFERNKWTYKQIDDHRIESGFSFGAFTVDLLDEGHEILLYALLKEGLPANQYLAVVELCNEFNGRYVGSNASARLEIHTSQPREAESADGTVVDADDGPPPGGTPTPEPSRVIVTRVRCYGSVFLGMGASLAQVGDAINIFLGRTTSTSKRLRERLGLD